MRQRLCEEFEMTSKSLTLKENQLDLPVASDFTSPVRNTAVGPAVSFTPPKRGGRRSPAPFQSPQFGLHAHSSSPQQYPPYTVQIGDRIKPLVSQSGASPNPKGRKVVRCLENQFNDLDHHASMTTLVSTQPEFYIHSHRSADSSYQYQTSDTDARLNRRDTCTIPHLHSFATTCTSPDSTDDSYVYSHHTPFLVAKEQFSSPSQGLDIRNFKHYRNLPITLEDLLSDESSTDVHPTASDNTSATASYHKPPHLVPEPDLEEMAHGSELLQKAEDFCQRLLLRRGMRCFIRNVLVRRKLAKAAIQHYQQWKLKMFFQIWKRKVESQRRQRLLRALAVWRTRAVAQKRLQKVFLEKNQCLVVTCFTIWQDRFHGAMRTKKALQHYQLKLCCRIVRLWKAEAKKARVRMGQLVPRAEVFCCNRVKERAFLVWRAWILYRADCRSRASLFLQRVQLCLVLQSWKKLAHTQRRYRAMAEGFIQINQKRTLQDALAVWREECSLREKSRQAECIFSLKLKRLVFQGWRVYIYQCTLKKLCEMYLNQKTTALLQASFNQWVCSTASLAGEGLLTSRLTAAHQTGLLYRAFAAWRRTTRLGRSHRVIRTMQERRMLREYFQIWKASWSHMKGLKERGSELEKWKAKLLWARWSEHLLHHKSERVATQRHNLRCLKEAFFFWRAEYSRHTALHSIEGSREKATLTSYFALWRAATIARSNTAKISLAEQLHCQKILTKCFLQWRCYTRRREDELGACADTLQSVARRIRLTSCLKYWRRQLQCQELVSAQLIRRKETLFYNCFSSWKQHTVTSYEQTSRLFLTKLQLAFTQCNAPVAVTQSCLHNISSNLGLEETVDAFCMGRRAISLPHFQLHQAAPTFQAGRVSQVYISSSDASGLVLSPVARVPHPQLHVQTSSPPLKSPVHSTPYPGPEISSQPLHMHSFDDASHSSDVAASAPIELPKANGMRATITVNGRDSNTTLQNESGSDNTCTGKNLVRRQLFENETEKMTPPRNVSTDERSPSPTEVCGCVDPATVHQIKEVQQKLASLSSSFEKGSHISWSLHQTAVLQDPLLPNVPIPKGHTPDPMLAPEVTDAYPTLTPPPGFVTWYTDEIDKLQVDVGTPKHGHLQLGRSPIISHSRQPHCTATRSLTSQIYHSSSTSESVVHENQFSTHAPKALQQVYQTVKYMQLYPCSKAFRVWRRHTEKQTALREKSVQFEQRARLQKMGDTFSLWRNQSTRHSRLRELQLLHHRRVDLRTLKTCLATWKARIERKLGDREAELQAISYHTSACLKKYFVCWRLAYRSLIVETRFQHYHVERIRRAFQRWRKATSQRLLVRHLCRKWRHITKVRRQEKQAQTLGVYWVLSSTWMKWRVVYIKQTVAQATVQAKERELLREAFIAWKLATSTLTSL